MAFVKGTASNYRDIWRKLVDFLVNNPDLVAANQQWEIKRGFFNPNIDYIHSVPYETSGILHWDVATCMGWDDSYQLYTDGAERKIGWVVRLIDAPNYLGFSSLTAITPTYYKVSSEFWHGSTNESDRQPKNWTIEWSDDGLAWTVSDTVSEQTAWRYDETRTFLVTGGAHKYWRMNITANNGDGTYVSIGRLRFYDSGDTWISRAYTTEFMFKTPGWVNAATDPTYSGMRLYIKPSTNIYNIEWMGAIGFDPLYGWQSQPSQLQDRYSPLWEFDTPYWFIANGARLIVVMNVGERWIAAYLGKFLPFGTKAQYAYPMIVGGSNYSPLSWSATSYCWNIQAGYNATTVYRPNTGWVNFHNRGYTGGLSSGATQLAPTFGQGMQAGNRQLPDSAYVLVPYIIEIDDDAYGELDGMRWISGNNQIPGNVIEDETGQEWLVFCNHFLIGIHDFAAVELK